MYTELKSIMHPGPCFMQQFFTQRGQECKWTGGSRQQREQIASVEWEHWPTTGYGTCQESGETGSRKQGHLYAQDTSFKEQAIEEGPERAVEGDTDWPGSHHMPRTQVSWNTFGHQMESMWCRSYMLSAAWNNTLHKHLYNNSRVHTPTGAFFRIILQPECLSNKASSRLQDYFCSVLAYCAVQNSLQ